MLTCESLYVIISFMIEAAEYRHPDFMSSQIETQVRRYIDFEFHTKIGISKDMFKDQALSLLSLQPEEFSGRYDLPVVAIGSVIPIAEQYQMLGINYMIGEYQVENERRDIPDRPYLVWMNDGRSNFNRSVLEVRSNYLENERGADIYDGIGLYLSDPSLVKSHYVELPGSRLDSENVPCLGLWMGWPGLARDWVGHADFKWGSATCGK